MSADEQSLLIVSVLFAAAVGIFALSTHIRGRALLRNLREGMDVELWRSLGAPASPFAALRDGQGRWRRFLRSGEYRRRLAPELAEQIDDYRRRNQRMLIVFGVAVVLLLVRFWPEPARAQDPPTLPATLFGIEPGASYRHAGAAAFPVARLLSDPQTRRA